MRSDHRPQARGLGMMLVGLLAGMLLITPATAHMTQNTKHVGRHAWNQVIKQKVYTKAQANRRYFTKGQADARFVPQGGAAGGDLTGAYPDPSIAEGSVGGSQVGDVEVRVSSVSVANGTFGSDQANCFTEAGEKLLGGGATWGAPAFDDTTAAGTHLVYSTPTGAGNGWQAGGYNGSGATRTLFVRAVCLTA